MTCSRWLKPKKTSLLGDDDEDEEDEEDEEVHTPIFTTWDSTLACSAQCRLGWA